MLVVVAGANRAKRTKLISPVCSTKLQEARDANNIDLFPPLTRRG